MAYPITIVIPVFNLTEERFRNFDFILTNYISKLGIKILVLEQVHNDQPTNVFSLVNLLQNPDVCYIPIFSDKNIFHKSYILNRSVKFIDTEYMWMMDADVFLRYAYILERLDDQDVICPFEHILLLNDRQTKKFIEDKSFIVAKDKKFQSISRFGPLSFIIKTNLFRLNLMGEQYTGWGWEDLDFAHRITQKYKVLQLDVNGLHLWHETSELNPEQEKINRKLFFESRKMLTYKYIDNTPSIPITKNKLSEALESQNKMIDQPRRSVVHIFAPALLPGKTELYNRELMAIESIIRAKVPNVTVIMVCDSEEAKRYERDFKIVSPPRSSSDLGDKRCLPYLSDLFREASKYCSEDDIVFYTNSDCCIALGIYNRLVNYQAPAIEYHRRDVDADTIQGVFGQPSIIKETGVDGLAFRKKFFVDNSYLVPDFFIGEPHWDTAICGALRTKNVSDQNTTDLYHPNHEQTWDPSKLSIPGKHNDRLYRDFLEYGISNIRLLSSPMEHIKTSIIIVNYGVNEKRVRASKIAMQKLESQNLLNCEFIFVDAVVSDTAFLELKNKPNWTHIIIQEKDSNKDIFQKEAMMNIGAKRAKGEVIIFMDSDVWTENPNWLNAISEKVLENPNRIISGYSFCQDSLEEERVFVSSGMNICKNIESNLYENPGLAMALSKEMLVKNNYLNPYQIIGGGDSIIMHEYSGKSHPGYRCSWQARFPKIHSIVRELEFCYDLDYVNYNIIHENHGKINMDYYSARYHCLDYFSKEIKELVRVGENGLLEWINPNCVEREIVRRRYEFISERITRQTCKQIIENRQKGE